MAEYEAWGAQMAWRPFIMYFQPSDLRTASCNTDSLGFRFSADAEGKVARVDQWDGNPCNIVLGNSVAFSVGSTSDANSLAARMSYHGGETWLNFSGRALCSQPGIFDLYFHRHYVEAVNRIVLFSGANDLFLYYVPKVFDPTFGIFFFSDVFKERMKAPENPGRVQRMREVVIPKPRQNKQPPDIDAIIAERRPTRERAVDMLVRSLENRKMLANGLGIELVYVLQPVRSWVKTPWTEEERELTAERREGGSIWNAVLAKVMDEEHHRWFAGRLAEQLGRLGIPFLDMNEVLSDHPRHREWLFIDYLHLTDAAYVICAQVLAQPFQRSTAREFRADKGSYRILE
ncbi:MAG: hypothetical protein ABR557_10745 [Pyrinomonadaceae bacterium]